MSDHGGVLGGVVREIRGNVAELPMDEPTGWILLAMMGLAVPIGGWVLVLGTRQFRQGYRIFASDPVGAGEAHLESGVVEVEGSAASLGRSLTGEYTNETAFAQKYHRERKRERTDDDGDTTTSWRTTERGSDAVPFLVEDETGSVAVDPGGASLSISQTEIKSRNRSGRRERKYRDHEGRIEPGDSVYVYGQLRTASDPDDAPGDTKHYIGDGADVSEFVVSDGSELRTVLRYVGLGALLTVAGVLWIPLATTVFLVMVEEAFGVPTASWLLALLG